MLVAVIRPMLYTMALVGLVARRWACLLLVGLQLVDLLEAPAVKGLTQVFRQALEACRRERQL